MSRTTSTFEPTRWQRDVMDSDSKSVSIVGPRRSGKTRIMLERVHKHCVDNPGARILIVCADKSAMLEYYWRDVLGSRYLDRYIYNDSPCIYGNGSVVQFESFAEFARTEYGRQPVDIACVDDTAVFSKAMYDMLANMIARKQVITTSLDLSDGWVAELIDSGETEYIHAVVKEG